MKTEETVTCECGKETPLETAIMDERGCWTCPECQEFLNGNNDETD